MKLRSLIILNCGLPNYSKVNKVLLRGGGYFDYAGYVVTKKSWFYEFIIIKGTFKM